MKIILTGELDPELISLGLKTGDELEVTPCQVSTVGCMHFSIYKSGITINCSIWPVNYTPQIPSLSYAKD